MLANGPIRDLAVLKVDRVSQVRVNLSVVRRIGYLDRFANTFYL